MSTFLLLNGSEEQITLLQLPV